MKVKVYVQRYYFSFFEDEEKELVVKASVSMLQQSIYNKKEEEEYAVGFDELKFRGILLKDFDQSYDAFDLANNRLAKFLGWDVDFLFSCTAEEIAFAVRDKISETCEKITQKHLGEYAEIVFEIK